MIYSLIIVISIIIAARFPISNDEAYYIAFAKDLQLSYVDAPPFVAYLNLLQIKSGFFMPLVNRFWVIILHLIATAIIMRIVWHHNFARTRPFLHSDREKLSEKLLVTFLLTYIVPIFGLYGIFILPDSGLILGLSIMLLASDNIVWEKQVSVKNGLFLALGLGIGLLSKYHILPLGGGMILGLYIDLICINSQAKLINLVKLIISVTLGLIIAAPLFIWNYTNHYASFIFQLQHGFGGDHWQFVSTFSFILGALLYLGPWFVYMLGKYGLFKSKRYYLFIPVISLSLILIISSFRKNILPHWLAPAFWLLIPYTVINIKNLKPLKLMCKYTGILWLILVFILVLPGGMLNIKKISKLFNPDTTGLADLLLWQELPVLFANNIQLQHSLTWLKPTQNCHNKYKLIAAVRWYWTAQLEYNQVFNSSYKILNLDLQSSNFYIWRDNLPDFANCPVLVIANMDNLNDLAKLLTIYNSYTIYGIDDYKSLNLIIIEGIFKNKAVLDHLQQNLLNNPRY